MIVLLSSNATLDLSDNDDAKKNKGEVFNNKRIKISASIGDDLDYIRYCL